MQYRNEIMSFLQTQSDIVYDVSQTHLIFVNILIHFKYMDSQFIRPGHFAVK